MSDDIQHFNEDLVWRLLCALKRGARDSILESDVDLAIRYWDRERTEAARLREENAALRKRNSLLEQQAYDCIECENGGCVRLIAALRAELRERAESHEDALRNAPICTWNGETWSPIEED